MFKMSWSDGIWVVWLWSTGLVSLVDSQVWDWLFCHGLGHSVVDATWGGLEVARQDELVCWNMGCAVIEWWPSLEGAAVILGPGVVDAGWVSLVDNQVWDWLFSHGLGQGIVDATRIG